MLRRMITAAEEKYMGFWLNGGDERMSLLLMRLGIPGFVLHEYMPGETDVPVSSLRDFLEDSTTVTSTNPYDVIEGSTLEPVRQPTDVHGSAPLLSRDELWMSSSWFAQGPHERGAPAPAVIPPTPPAPSAPPSTFTARREPPPSKAPEEDDMSDYRSPVAPPAREETDWIQPPAIQALTPSSKAWERWNYDEDEEFFGLLGKKNKDVRGKVFFDRTLRRKIYIIGHDIPDNVWDPRNFGLPVPNRDFVSRSGNKSSKHRRSQWMYMQESPSEAMPSGTLAPLPRRSQRPEPHKPPLKR
ncbi:hypothetical protein GGX14DRAFT_581633 [Mycena pura]|uniref:Uncharacterized protein n=1 Tax=Mycena pura TaxID=153505 RepID=A0AAD7E5B1_9AGAR|nr:hypothetical protein GGX14DRAFT_581633 [Mycena pura]